ncbi:MAG: hypothetical protein MZV65_35695 [Chromatiales bacterium]|nr:hypothetical protein [Chromatiales bacterium]
MVWSHAYRHAADHPEFARVPEARGVALRSSRRARALPDGRLVDLTGADAQRGVHLAGEDLSVDPAPRPQRTQQIVDDAADELVVHHEEPSFTPGPEACSVAGLFAPHPAPATSLIVIPDAPPRRIASFAVSTWCGTTVTSSFFIAKSLGGAGSLSPAGGARPGRSARWRGA